MFSLGSFNPAVRHSPFDHARSALGSGGGSTHAHHVYAADQGLGLSEETVEALHYDDTTQLLLAVKGGVVFAYDMGGDTGGSPDTLVWTYPLQEGPSVRAARVSPDRGLLAVQRGPRLLELVDLASGNCCVHASERGRHDILGFFFTEWPGAEVVVVTRGGLELCVFAPRRQGLRCREVLRVPVSWWAHSHDTRCCLVGAPHPGGPGVFLQGWQFVSGGMVTLPPFTIPHNPTAPLPSTPTRPGPSPTPPARSTTPPLPVSTGGVGSAWGGFLGFGGGGAHSQGAAGTGAGAATAPGAARPAAAGAAAGAAGAGGGAAAAQQGQAGGTIGMAPGSTNGMAPGVWLLKMYGRVYCVALEATAGRLELYRIYTDTVVLQHVYSVVQQAALGLSVVDNLLVVTHAAAGVTLLYDVCADTAEPIAPPLPLGLLGPPALAPLPGTPTLPPPSPSPSSASLSSAFPLAAMTPPGVTGAAATASTASAPAPGTPGSSTGSLQAAAAATSSAAAATPAGTAATPAAAAAAPKPAAWALVKPGGAGSMGHWRFYVPSLLVDPQGQAAYRLVLDLPALCDSSSHPGVLVSVLQRRRAAARNHARLVPATTPGLTLPPVLSSQLSAAPNHPASNPPMVAVVGGGSAALGGASVRQLLLSAVRTALQERLPMGALRSMFGDLCRGAAEVGAAAAAGKASPAALAGVLGPSDVCTQVFRWLHDEEVVDAPYLQAALCEYSAAAAAAGLQLGLDVEVLGLELLLQQSQPEQVAVQLYCQWPSLSTSLAACLERACAGAGVGGASSGAAGLSGLGALVGAGSSHGHGSGVSLAGRDGAAAVSAAALALRVRGAADALAAGGRGSGGAAGGGGAHMHSASAGSSPAPSPGPGPSRSSTPQPSPQQQPTARAGVTPSPGAGTGASSDGATVVRQLLAAGHIVRAARLAQRLAVRDVLPVELLEAAARTGNMGTTAAVYRCFRDALMPQYPSFAQVRAALLLPRVR